jgi:hypothetical protein
MTTDEAITYVDKYMVTFQRDLTMMPSGEETRQLGRARKWSLWGYLRWGGETLQGCVSFPTWTPKFESQEKAKGALFGNMVQHLLRKANGEGVPVETPPAALPAAVPAPAPETPP